MSSELAKEDTIRIIVMAIVIAVVLLFLGVGLLVIIHICIVGRAFRRRGLGVGINTGTFDRSNCNNHISMSLDDIQKLPCYDYTANDKAGSSSNPVDCAVCLENFKVGENCRRLPLCGHSFHAECVDSWLLRNPICPVCRTIAGSSKAARLVLGEENREDTHSDEVRIQVRDRQIGEGSNVTDISHESGEHQLNLRFAIETIATTL